MNYAKALLCARLAHEVYHDLDGYKFRQFPDYEPYPIENQATDTQCAIVPDPASDLIYVTFRGTNTLPDWATNIRLSRELFEIKAIDVAPTLQSDTPGTRQILPVEQIRPANGRTDLAPEAPQARMHQGFVTAYMSVQDQIHLYVQKHNPGGMMITGHSLGAALATLCAIDFELTYESKYPIEVYTFGSPRVGTPEFRNLFNASVPNCYRFVNGLDIVPGLPRWWSGYRHVGQVDHIGRHFTLNLLTTRVTHHFMANYVRELEALA